MITVEQWTPDGTQMYPQMDEEIQEIKYSSLMFGGYATLAFSHYRKPWVYDPALQINNIVKVLSDHGIRWEGKISGINIGTDAKTTIEADGIIGRMKKLISTSNVATGEKGSSWITDHCLSVAGLTAGNITTGDYAFPAGINFQPEIFLVPALEKINACNGYVYGPGSGMIFDYHPMSTTPDYYLDIEDCDTQIKYSIENIENYLHVTYSLDGTNYLYFWWPAAGPAEPSATIYGRCDGVLVVPNISTLDHAQQMATVALNWRKRMHPATSIVARKITDANGAEIPIPTVGAGKLLHMRGLYPTVETITQTQAVNELSTFEVVMAAVDIDAETVTLSPGAVGDNLPMMLAQSDMEKAQTL